MKTVTLKFNVETPDDERAVTRAVTVDSVYAALERVANEVFRPARKHGYHDLEIGALLTESAGLSRRECAARSELIGLLEKKFFAILEEQDVQIFD